MSTILLIDDDVIGLEMLAHALKSEGYNAVTISDPETAAQTAIELKPDFIIIDVVMPKKSGLELCRELKLNPATREIPVMFLSASEDVNHAIASLHLGCVDYLRKPIRAPDLAEVIRKHDMIRQISQVWEPARKELKTLIRKYSTPGAA